MDVLKIGGENFSHLIAHNGYGFSENVIVSEARDINGNLNLEIINRKIKLFYKFIPMEKEILQTLLAAIAPYAVEVTYHDPRTNGNKTIQAYVGEQKYEFYSDEIVNGFQLNFIEL